jgi:hypothetical protein
MRTKGRIRKEKEWIKEEEKEKEQEEKEEYEELENYCRVYLHILKPDLPPEFTRSFISVSNAT